MEKNAYTIIAQPQSPQSDVQISSNVLTELLHYFPKPLVQIITEYFEIYLDTMCANFSSAVSAILELTANRLALGFDNGVVGVYDLITKTIILNKTPRYVTTSLCQLNDNILISGYSNFDELMVWDFKNNVQKMIKLPAGKYCKNNGMRILKNNVSIYSSVDECLYVIDFNHMGVKIDEFLKIPGNGRNQVKMKKPKLYQVDRGAKCYLKNGSKLMICYQDQEYHFKCATYLAYLADPGLENYVRVVNVNNYIRSNIDNDCFDKICDEDSNCCIHFSKQKHIQQMVRIDEYNFATLDSVFDGHCCSYFCEIHIANTKTKSQKLFFRDYECDNIISIQYLKNNHLALHRYNRIEIYDIIEKQMIQQIKSDRIITDLIEMNHGFAIIESNGYPVPRRANNKSRVQIYQKFQF